MGVYNPVPRYHFEEFSKETTHLVNISRIAHLVNSYDEINNLGISKTQISGNDFMLTQETDVKDLHSIILHTKLISARDTINCSLDEYIHLIKSEFKIGTYRTNKEVIEGIFKINYHSKMPLELDIIEEGIHQGLKLRSDYM